MIVFKASKEMILSNGFMVGDDDVLFVKIKEQNIGIYGYIGTWILRKYRKYRKISVDILTKISVMQKLTKIL